MKRNTMMLVDPDLYAKKPKIHSMTFIMIMSFSNVVSGFTTYHDYTINDSIEMVKN